MMKPSFFFFFYCLVFTINIHAQADTINAANHKLLTQNLKEATNTYLVYYTDSTMTKRTCGDIWIRKTSFVKQNGHDWVRFDWDWIYRDTIMQHVTNLCDRKTLAPVYHRADSRRRGITAWDFKAGAMVPADTVADNNAVKRGKVMLPIPVISWEEDMETYALLPITKTGQVFDIAFFDPNEETPAYHRYTVTGKEELQLNADTKVNCWILKILYDKNNYAQFWLTDKTKEVVKMKEYYNGRYRFKVKLY